MGIFGKVGDFFEGVGDFLGDVVEGVGGFVEGVGDFVVDLVTGDLFDFPSPPNLRQSSPATDGLLPRTAEAKGRPLPLLIGAPRTGGLELYRASDLDTQHVFLLLGEGPVKYIPEPQVDGVAVTSLPGGSYAAYVGTLDQSADPRSARLRHLEPSGQPVRLAAWDSDVDGWAPAAGTATATSALTVQDADAVVRVHLQARFACSSEQRKHVFFRLHWRLQGAQTWTDDPNTYEIVIGANENGFVQVQVPLRGGTRTFAQTTTGWHYSTSGTAATLDTQKDPTYHQEMTLTSAQSFGAGAYEVHVEFVSASREGTGDLIQGELLLHAVEVIEANDALALQGSAYVVLTTAVRDADRSRNYAVTPAGLAAAKVWDGAQWRTGQWTNNPVWAAAMVLMHPAGNGVAEGEIDWEQLKAEAAHCDEAVSTLVNAAAVMASGADWVESAAFAGSGVEWLLGYKARHDATGEVHTIYHHDRDAGRLYVEPAWSTPPTTAQTVTVQEQRYRVDQVLDAESQGLDAARTLLKAAGGDLWRGPDGLWRMAVARPRTPVATLDVGDWFEDSFQAEQIDVREQPAGLLVRFRDQRLDHEQQSLFVGDPQGRTDKTLSLNGVVNHRQAKRLGWYHREQRRVDWRATGTARLTALGLEPYDVVQVKHWRLGWGYDITDPSAPVDLGDAHPTVKSMLLVRATSTDGDKRTLELMEYDPAVYNDAPDIEDPPVDPIAYRNPWQPPEPVESLRAVFLGDLTSDGVWNPEIQVSWTHPSSSTVSRFHVYYRLQGQDDWTAGPITEWTSARVRVPYTTGTVEVTVVAVSVLGIPGDAAAAPIATVQVTADLGVPATPTGLTGTFADTVVWTWDAATEADFSHYEISLDGGTTWERVDATRYEISAPTLRIYAPYVRAVDRSGNASTAASAVTILSPPAAPSTTYLRTNIYANTAVAWVDSAFPESPGHRGYVFEWRKVGDASWTAVAGTSMTVTVPVQDFTADTQDVEIRYAEVDVMGQGTMSTAITVTLSKPDYSDLIQVPPKAQSLWVPSDGELFEFRRHVTGSKGTAPL